MESSHTEIRCQGLGTMANGSLDSRRAVLPDRYPMNRHGSLWTRHLVALPDSSAGWSYNSQGHTSR